MRSALALGVALVLAAPANVQAAEPAPQQTASRPGRPLTIAGSVLIMASAGGYIAMAVGLGMGNNADAEVRSLQSSEDLEQRREVIERGELGNRLAVGAGLAAAALMATGIALVVVGRKKAAERRTAIGPLPLQRGAGLQLGARF